MNWNEFQIVDNNIIIIVIIIINIIIIVVVVVVIVFIIIIIIIMITIIIIIIKSRTITWRSNGDSNTFNLWCRREIIICKWDINIRARRLICVNATINSLNVYPFWKNYFNIFYNILNYCLFHNSLASCFPYYYWVQRT